MNLGLGRLPMGRMGRGMTVIVAASWSLTLSMGAAAWAAPGDTSLVRGVCPSDMRLDDLDAVSGDGRFVVADCRGLGAAPMQVYERDQFVGRTVLVSRATGADGAQGSRGASFRASVSADGRFVAFASDDTSLAPGLLAGYRHVFVRDLRRHTTTVIGGARRGASGCGHADDPSISADGRFVAFDGGCSSDHYQVVVRDLHTNKDALASRANGARGAVGNGDSVVFSVSLSADGRRVAFGSEATNLTPRDHDRGSDVFVRDLHAHSTTLASRASGPRGAKGNQSSDFAVISADGRSVAFDSRTALVGADRRSDTVYVRNLRRRTTTLVSRASGPNGDIANDSVFYPDSISGDGHLVAFQTTATNLDADDTDDVEDVFVRNLTAQTTALISRASGPAGAKGNDRAYDGRLTADGRNIFFGSRATNLTPDETDGGVFKRQLARPDARLGPTAAHPGYARSTGHP